MTLECSTLVLDLDETISDPSLGISRCMNHALQIHGFDTVSSKDIAREIGPPLDEMFLKLAPEVSTENIPALVSTYRERYSDCGYSENLIYPNIFSAIEQAYKAGLRLGVCTSKRTDFAEKIILLFGLSRFFDFVDGGDIGISKEMQLARLLSCGAIDRGAIMVGDRAVDIHSATANGLRSIGVLWGFGSNAELTKASPTHIVETVSEFCRIVI